VITGYNTDVEFEGVTYHVQTEDKGLANPIIMSLVYNGGTILASKRTPYDDLIAEGFDEAVLEERLNRQHKLMCAAIKAGRLDDLKKLAAKDADTAKNSKSKREGKGTKSKRATSRSSRQPETTTGGPSESVAAVSQDSGALMMPIPKPDFPGSRDLDSIMAAPEPEVSVVKVLDFDSMLPDNAVTAIDSEMAGYERPSNNHLTVEIFGDTQFRGGEKRSVGVMVCRGSQRKIVPNAQVMVKIIGSSFRPLIYHAETDGNGIARVELDVPKFKSGRAAFLVRAMAGGEATELRQQVQHA
jgi:hypothetical protein